MTWHCMLLNGYWPVSGKELASVFANCCHSCLVFFLRKTTGRYVIRVPGK